MRTARLVFLSGSRRSGFSSRKAAAADDQEEISSLRELLKQWSDAYYNSGTPMASDDDYDLLRARLAALDPHAVDLVGAAPPATATLRFRHTLPMLSLRSTRHLEEVEEFCASTARLLETSLDDLAWSTEYKYDGMALALHYDAAGQVMWQRKQERFFSFLFFIVLSYCGP